MTWLATQVDRSRDLGAGGARVQRHVERDAALRGILARRPARAGGRVHPGVRGAAACPTPPPCPCSPSTTSSASSGSCAWWASAPSVPVPRTLWFELDARRHRLALLRHGTRRRRRPARHHAVPVRVVAVRSGTGRPGPAAGRRRSGSWPSCTTWTSPPTDIAFLRARPARRHRPAPPRGRPARLLRMGGGRRGPLAAHRAHLRLARGPLARRRGRRRHQLGRRPHRQHDVPRLRAGGRARLGDGGGRAPRDRHRLDGLPAPLPRRHRPAGGAPGHARTSCASTTWPPPTSATRARRRGTSTSTPCTRRCGTPSS